MAVKFNRNFNVNRVVKRLVRTVLALYVGGTIMTTFGSVMLGTCSPFYSGLSLIGWSVGSGNTSALTGSADTAYNACVAAGSTSNTIMAASGSGVLAVVGIIAIAQIVTDFVTW